MKWPSSSLLLVLIAAAAFGQTPSGEGGRRSGSATSPTSALAPDACTPFAQVFCAHNERFWVSAIFSAPSLGISSAAATAVPITNDTGYFWFFSSNNVELVVKVVDGRAFNGYYWVFCAALSDLAYAVTVTDTETAVVKTYANAPGNLVSIADTAAFLGSTSTTCRYDVGPPIPATFGIGGGGGSVSVRTQSDCPWTAVSNSLFIYNVSPSSGTGSGTVQFSVAAMFGSLTRHGRLTVAGVTLEITQGP